MKEVKMAILENAKSWASSIKFGGEESLPVKFWTALLSDIGVFTEAFNIHNPQFPILTEGISPGSQKLIFLDHELLLAMDVRSGTLQYHFITPILQQRLGLTNGVTARGVVTLDLHSSFFLCTSEPPLNLGRNVVELGSWPSYERLAQYLIQKLVEPTKEDPRFVISQ